MSPSAQDSTEAASGPATDTQTESHSGNPSDTAAETQPETDKQTSCLGCRKRKLKCSRDVPSCTHCQRLDVACVYDAKKAKPGLRPGAIEALNQRIEALENALARQGSSTVSSTPAPEVDSNVVGILAVLAQELQKLNTAAAKGVPQTTVTTAPPTNGTNGVAHNIDSPSPATTASPVTVNGHRQDHRDHRRKRRRMVDSCGNPDIDLAQPLEDMASAVAATPQDQDPTTSPGLPPAETLQAVVNAYFVAVQPWIPVLHETQFRRRMHDAEQRPRLTFVLHAMIVAAARYVQAEDLPDGSGGLDALLLLAQRSRGHVLLVAMDRLSVESLQALIILAFHDIGSGAMARAWSIVASLTRTVDYLGLNNEDTKEITGGRPLLRPMTLLSPPHNWIEEEERRRVFWCVLLLDRFCSVATGWHTGLAAADVHRRLPADGFFFHKEEPVLTPYMYGPPAPGPPDSEPASVADRPREPSDAPAHASSTENNTRNMSNVGAFAYCIEAAESLSRVVSTFLRQHVDFGSRSDVSRWLTRFKELDLRLVHWKMYLPQRWRDSNVSRQPALVNMDPNLTLAHITHNTSTILLHQRIAYPDPAWWTRIVKLPSFCSAETCQNAAVETAAITSKYLRYTPKHRPVSSPFAFCVYISARVLLVHWRCEAGAVDVLPEFWSLVRSLEDMDRRWIGRSSSRKTTPTSTLSTATSATATPTLSLAGHYAQQLKDLHRQCLASPTFVVDLLGYTEVEPELVSSTISEPVPEAAPEAVQTTVPPAAQPVVQAPVVVPTPLPHIQQLAQVHPSVHPTWRMQPLDQLSPVMTTYHSQQQHVLAADNAAYGGASVVSVPASVPTGHTHTDDDLAAISHLLLDQQFMDRDRVISFEDSFFAAPGRWT
ncbi:hypothetical protein SEUCBS139899_010476 [Sporothrix eucalyptigena]|uniref:Zn(2)-C6 fungal-type domain-containing protein n=1 Tax=Sporothrix eucalyptigena TaxID=1812306 RepID=A0ABP0D1E6_9PEZI